MAGEIKEEKSEGTKKNWFVKHKVMTGALAIVAVIVIIVVLGGGEASFDVSLGDTKADCRLDDKNICKFLNKTKDLDAVSMELEAGADGASTKSTIKIQGSGRSQIITTLNGVQMNIITIGNTVYVKGADGTWAKYLDEKGEIDTGANSDWKADFEKSLNDENSKITYEKIGEEKCGDLNCIKYKMINPDDQIKESFILIDDKEYLMRKVYSEQDGGKTEITFSYDNVSIEEPSPVKEVTTPAELYQGLNLQ